MTTLITKSGGVPGFTICLAMPLWCEWINVSSKSRTRIFRLTMPVVAGERVVRLNDRKVN